MTKIAETAICHIGAVFSSFAETSESFVSGRPWEVMQKTSTFCPTPFNFGFPRYFVSNSDSLTRASLTLLEIAIPPSAEKGSIRAVMLTSSPMTSLSVINISP